MTEDPKKKPIGSPIQDFSRLGRKRSSEPDSQISSNSDNQVVQYQESQRAELLDSQIIRKQDKQMVSYLREKKPERKAQIAYLPPALIKRLKRYAVDHEREISEVVADAVEQFLDEAEGTTPE